MWEITNTYSLDSFFKDQSTWDERGNILPGGIINFECPSLGSMSPSWQQHLYMFHTLLL